MNARIADRPGPPLRSRLELLLWRRGAWPVLLLTLLLLTALLWWGRVLPLQRQIAALDGPGTAPSPATAVAAVDAQAAADRARLQALRQVLLPYRDHPAQLRWLVRQTQRELQWTQAQFTQQIDAELGLARLQITIPVGGTYPAVQRALERALLHFPYVSIDQIQFRRDSVDRQQVETSIRLSMWLHAPGHGMGAR